MKSSTSADYIDESMPPPPKLPLPEFIPASGEERENFFRNFGRRVEVWSDNCVQQAKINAGKRELTSKLRSPSPIRDIER